MQRILNWIKDRFGPERPLVLLLLVVLPLLYGLADGAPVVPSLLMAIAGGAFLWILYTLIMRSQQKASPAEAPADLDADATHTSLDQRWNEWRDQIARREH
jgi:hypothetical protein